METISSPFYRLVEQLKSCVARYVSVFNFVEFVEKTK
jgi:hypothetical protein